MKLAKWGTLIVLSMALMIIIIDTTILNVSLGNIIRDFKTDIQSIQWVITAYSLTLAALTVTGGRLGDLFGRKRMFVLGAVIFAIGSFITTISQNVPQMIIGEAIIEGIGAALMLPATASLLVASYEGHDRAVAFGVWGGIAGASSAIGPLIGGFLTTNFSWRWGFLINVFVAAALVLGSFIIKESRDKEEKPNLDIIGVILSSIGLLSLVFGFIESSTYGWIEATQVFKIGDYLVDFNGFSISLITVLIGVVFLLIFIVWEAFVEERGQTPLVSLKLFKNRQFTTGALTTAVMSVGLSGLVFSIPVFLQSVRGLNAFDTGLSLLPMSLTLLIVAPLSAFISQKIRPKYMIQVGLVLNGLGYYVLRSLLNVDSTGLSLAPGFILFGAGMGLVMAQVSNLTLSAVSPQQSGEASGVNNTFRQLGSTLGSAIIGSVLLTALATNLTSGINDSQVIPNQLKTTIAQAVSTQTSNVEFGGGAKLDKNIPPAIGEEITKISHKATVNANKDALMFGIYFAILGLVVSLFLPNVKTMGRGQSVAGH